MTVMKTNISIEHGITVVKPPERVDKLTANDFTTQTLAQMEKRTKAIVVDLSHVAYMSCSGLNAFIKIAKEMHRCHVPLAFFGMNESVSMIFSAAGLEKIVSIFSSRNVAMLAVGADPEIYN